MFRHYWVVPSLASTSLATVILLKHMETVTALARVAAEADPAQVDTLLAGLRGELLHAGVGMLVLVLIELLNVFKPPGMTAYGRRKAPQTGPPSRRPRVWRIA